MPCNCATGSYTGTGSAQTLELGFIPATMDIVNVTDGDEFHLWFDGMAAGSAVLVTTAVASASSNEFTRFTGTAATTSTGVTVGTALSESAKVYRYRAWFAY